MHRILYFLVVYNGVKWNFVMGWLSMLNNSNNEKRMIKGNVINYWCIMCWEWFQRLIDSLLMLIVIVLLWIVHEGQYNYLLVCDVLRMVSIAYWLIVDVVSRLCSVELCIITEMVISSLFMLKWHLHYSDTWL